MGQAASKKVTCMGCTLKGTFKGFITDVPQRASYTGERYVVFDTRYRFCGHI